MFKTLTTRAVALALGPLTLLGPLLTGADVAAANGTANIPYAVSHYCGTMSGPVYANQAMVYKFAARINNGPWQYSQWMASNGFDDHRLSNGNWVWYQTNEFVTIPANGSTVEMWVLLSTDGFNGWIPLGTCTTGGIVMN